MQFVSKYWRYQPPDSKQASHLQIFADGRDLDLKYWPFLYEFGRSFVAKNVNFFVWSPSASAPPWIIIVCIQMEKAGGLQWPPLPTVCWMPSSQELFGPWHCSACSKCAFYILPWICGRMACDLVIKDGNFGIVSGNYHHLGSAGFLSKFLWIWRN